MNQNRHGSVGVLFILFLLFVYAVFMGLAYAYGYD